MKVVFFDVDTQLDFLLPAGALYVPGAEGIIANLKRLTDYAAARSIPVVSTLDTHTEDDGEFAEYSFHPHCVEGATGHNKVSVTLAHPNQHFIRKSTFDCFTNPALEPLLERLGAGVYVVYGVVTEICVECAAMGLLGTGARVHLVTDAIQSLDAVKAAAFLERFVAQGGELVTVAGVCG